MYTLYELRQASTDRLVAQCTSYGRCEREAIWRDLIDWYHVPVERDAAWGAPPRYVAPWPESKVSDFLEMYKSGEPMRSLVEFFDTPASSLSKLARKHGLPRRNPYVGSWKLVNGRWSDWTVAESDKIISLRQEGLSLATIAKRVGRTKSAVSQRFFRLQEKAPRWWEPDEDEVILFMKQEGVSAEDIATHTTKSTSAIVRRLKILKARARPAKTMMRHGAIWTPERIKKLTNLWFDGCSASEIAEALGCGISRSSVVGKVYRLGLTHGGRT